MEELSREINISRSTIHKILNNKGRVTEKTRKIVLEAVQRHQFVPNKAAKNLAKNRSYDIALIGYCSERAPYSLNGILTGFRRGEEEFRDHGLHASYAISEPGNPVDQARAALDLADQGVDGFAVYPENVEPIRACIEELVHRGKIVCTVNKDVPGTPRQHYVGCDHFKSGVLAAEVLGRMIPVGRDIAVLLGGTGVEHLDITDRYAGLKKKMERFPGVRLLEPYYHDGNTKTLANHVERILSENRNLGGIFDITYELDLISRIVSTYDNKVRLVGFDLSESVRNHMISHSIDAVVFQDLPTQGYLASRFLFHSLESRAVVDSPRTITKLEVVYEGNLEFYI